jgi:hypothetical protein
LYASGAARWEPIDLIKKQLNSGVSVFSPSGDYISDQMWNNIDADAQLY